MNNDNCEAVRLSSLSGHSFCEHFLRAPPHSRAPPPFLGNSPISGKGHTKVRVRAPPILGHCLMAALHSAGTGLNTVPLLQLLKLC